ncbi:hypothetical protein [Peribacillus muralis]|uniref:hypothetical protein n=1 Tax=Peribacillus muralis TaxID=264697 RepID=UPI0012EA6735|nr:hypothetical protein [Peribacillus muralis]
MISAVESKFIYDRTDFALSTLIFFRTAELSVGSVELSVGSVELSVGSVELSAATVEL